MQLRQRLCKAIFFSFQILSANFLYGDRCLAGFLSKIKLLCDQTNGINYTTGVN